MRPRRTDANHRQIKRALEQCGWLVVDTHDVPNWVDLTVYHPGRGVLRLVEVKTEKGKLRPSQERLIRDRWPVNVLRSVEDAVRLE